jgi:histidinol-phosphate aminotransferase
LTVGLSDLGWDVPPSGANFVFGRPPAPMTAADVAAALRAQRILVRHFEVPGLSDRLRITIGEASAVDRVLAAIAGMASV